MRRLLMLIKYRKRFIIKHGRGESQQLGALLPTSLRGTDLEEACAQRSVGAQPRGDAALPGAGERSRRGAAAGNRHPQPLPHRRPLPPGSRHPSVPAAVPGASAGCAAGGVVKAVGPSPWLTIAAPVSVPAAIASSRLAASTCAHILSLPR